MKKKNILVKLVQSKNNNLNVSEQYLNYVVKGYLREIGIKEEYLSNDEMLNELYNVVYQIINSQTFEIENNIIYNKDFSIRVIDEIPVIMHKIYRNKLEINVCSKYILMKNKDILKRTNNNSIVFKNNQNKKIVKSKI